MSAKVTDSAVPTSCGLPGGSLSLKQSYQPREKKTRKKGMFFTGRHDTRVSRLGCQKREKSEKKVAKLITLVREKGM